MATMTKSGAKIPMRRWWILIPTFFLVNFFCGLDRSVISMALPGGMQQELALQASMSGMITGNHRYWLDGTSSARRTNCTTR